jgi:hypothetical protein
MPASEEGREAIVEINYGILFGNWKFTIVSQILLVSISDSSVVSVEATNAGT